MVGYPELSINGGGEVLMECCLVPRWKHLLVVGGILTAFKQKGFLPRNTKRSLEDAFVKAANISLENLKAQQLERDSVSMILSRVMLGLSGRAKSLLNHDALVEVLTRSIYTSSEGFESGYFLSKIDLDVMLIGNLLTWPRQSNSFLELQARGGKPLFTSMNALARIIASSIVQAKHVETVDVFLNRLLEFSSTLAAQWKMNKLSEVDVAEEVARIDAESRKFTMPVVWQILKTILFTTTLVLYELINKLLVNPELCKPECEGARHNDLKYANGEQTRASLPTNPSSFSNVYTSSPPAWEPPPSAPTTLSTSPA